MKYLTIDSLRIIRLLVAGFLCSSLLLGQAGASCTASDASCAELEGLLVAESEVTYGAGYRSARNKQTAKAPTGSIRVTGVGSPPKDSQNATVRREMAERAALADAERKLVQAVTSSMTGRGQPPSAKKKTARRIRGHIKGYSVAGRRELPDGTIEIDLELPLRGR